MVPFRRVSKSFVHGLAVVFVLVWGAPAGAQGGAQASDQRVAMSNADYVAAKRHLSTELQAAKVACSTQTTSRREVCVADAEGKDWIAKADLEVAYRSVPRSRADASLARADARFWVARERCDDLALPARTACREQANTERATARDQIAAQRKREEHDASCQANGARSAASACAATVTR